MERAGALDRPVRMLLAQRLDNGAFENPAAAHRGVVALAPGAGHRAAELLAGHVRVRVEQRGDAAGGQEPAAPVEPLAAAGDLPNFALHVGYPRDAAGESAPAVSQGKDGFKPILC